MLMIGPSGTGKSMLAQRFPGLMPGRSDGDTLSATAVIGQTTGCLDAPR
jgi:magnesium chelatase family protein